MSKNRNRYTAPNSPKEIPVTEEAQQPQDQGTDQTSESQTDAQATGEQTTAADQGQPTQEAPVTQKADDEVEEVKSVQPKAVAPQQEGFTPVYKVELDLNGYAEAMAKTAAIVPEQGGQWQYSLFGSIKGILQTQDQEAFNQEWATLLQFFHKNKDGVFNEKFIFRFPEQWPGSTNEYTINRRVLYVILQTADVQTRAKALRELDLSLAFEGLSEDQRGKLFSFYGV